jgi:site-specific recombinase XerC
VDALGRDVATMAAMARKLGSAGTESSQRRLEKVGLAATVDRGFTMRREACGTHSMRRTKASLIYRRTKNLRAVQLLLGHAKLESTVRYLGIDVDDAIELAEQTEI